MAEIKRCYEALAKQSLDPHNYSGALFDVVFEIITADTFVAGVASKILDREHISPEERAVVKNPLLMEARWWRRENGQLFDIHAHDEVREAAQSIERLRERCDFMLSI